MRKSLTTFNSEPKEHLEIYKIPPFSVMGYNKNNQGEWLGENLEKIRRYNH